MRALRWGLVCLGALLLAPAAGAVQIEVHPSGASVPENLLRIELRFAAPQRMPFDTTRVRLIDANGATIPEALLDLALPNADGRRVTLLMDPGRVKTGVGPNVMAGRALHAGTVVRLVVDDAQTGAPDVVKAWTVTAADDRLPQPGAWQLTLPRPHTRDALIVDLREPISASAEGLIVVSDASGRRVEGRTALSNGDTVWRFTPTQPWRHRAYAVVAHPDLEDPAGNRRCAAFEQLRASELRCEAGATIAFEPRR